MQSSLPFRHLFSLRWLAVFSLSLVLLFGLVYSAEKGKREELRKPGPPPAPVIADFSDNPAEAGQRLTIIGTDLGTATSVVFSGDRLPCNQSQPPVPATADMIGPTANGLAVYVPYGAATGPVIVTTPSGTNQKDLTIKTSFSGCVQDDPGQTPIPNAKVIPALSFTPPPVPDHVFTTVLGLFMMTRILGPTETSNPRLYFAVDGSTAGGSPLYDYATSEVNVIAGRDNQICGPVLLARPETIVFFRAHKVTSASEVDLGKSYKVINAVNTRQTLSDASKVDLGKSYKGDYLKDKERVILDFPPDVRVRTPGGKPQLFLGLATLNSSVTPLRLPRGHYSSTIFQITPFGTTLTPGGRLSFPNRDGSPAGATVGLYRYEYRRGNENFGKFVRAGAAQVTADGSRVISDAYAVVDASFYFVSMERPTAPLQGRVLESDNERPVRRALVMVRGQFANTDGEGNYTLAAVPVLKAGNDEVVVQVKMLRPDGQVSRAEQPGRFSSINQKWETPLITMPPRAIRPPLQISFKFPKPLQPPVNEITLRASQRIKIPIDLIDPQPKGQDLKKLPPQIAVAGARFASLKPDGRNKYILHLTPSVNDRGTFELLITARSIFGGLVNQRFNVKVE